MKNRNSKQPSKKPFRLDNFIAVITLLAIAAFGLMVYADYNGYDLSAFLKNNKINNIPQQKTSAASTSAAVKSRQESTSTSAVTQAETLGRSYTVCIDPALGGSDSGASANGLTEKNVTLAVALKLKSELEQRGIKVVLTRDSDKTVANEARVSVCDKSQSDLLVSLRLNSAQNTAVSGFELWVNNKKPANSVSAADAIGKSMSTIIGIRNRGVKYGTVTNADENYYVNSKSKCASLVIQLGFISNKEDASLLKNNDSEVASKIAQGIVTYFKEKK
mgnify:FL=1